MGEFGDELDRALCNPQRDARAQAVVELFKAAVEREEAKKDPFLRHAERNELRQRLKRLTAEFDGLKPPTPDG